MADEPVLPEQQDEQAHETPAPEQLAAPADDSQANLWGMLCHLTALAQFIGIPFGHIIGPLIIWLIKKDEYPFVDQQGKASLNFQISMTVYGLVASLLLFVLIGFLLLPALVVLDIVCVVMASVKANKGESFNYPLSIRFIS